MNVTPLPEVEEEKAEEEMEEEDWEVGGWEAEDCDKGLNTTRARHRLP